MSETTNKRTTAITEAIKKAAENPESGNDAARLTNDAPACSEDLTASRTVALIAAEAAFEKKASDIVVQEVHAQLVITDYFVIATGANTRQVDAICEAIEEALRNKADMKPLSREGLEERTWVLLDYGDFIVHVFQPEHRDFYRLETIWNDAPYVDLVEAGVLPKDAQ